MARRKTLVVLRAYAGPTAKAGLADSLNQLGLPQNSGRRVFNAEELTRIHRQRLLENALWNFFL